MTTPHTHVSTAHTEGEDDHGVDRKDWRRMAIGLFAGLVLAAIVWFIFPSNAVDTVAQSPGAKEGAEYSESCLLYTSPSPRDLSTSRMPSSA